MKPLIARINAYSDLTDADFETLLAAPVARVTLRANAKIINVGDTLTHVFVVSRGWAIRYRTLNDGSRQIVNVMLPGDCFDLQALIDTKADHSVDSISAVEMLRARRDDFLNAIRANGRLATAFWWASVQEESILREHIVRLGRRSGVERLAHLLLELQRRLHLAGVSESDTIAMPLSRDVIADMLGLSPVHVSRSMSALRREALIRTSDSSVQILAPKRLAELAQFDPSYLHTDKKQRLA
ncbi:cAMP-binding proteins [alpha proteobacterium U9-1i]|nr:cAMP-binding proteins [alpha proteobacterium U9-1i]